VKSQQQKAGQKTAPHKEPRLEKKAQGLRGQEPKEHKAQAGPDKTQAAGAKKPPAQAKGGKLKEKLANQRRAEPPAAKPSADKAGAAKHEQAKPKADKPKCKDDKKKKKGKDKDKCDD
jgi:hypothetical protein